MGSFIGKSEEIIEAKVPARGVSETEKEILRIKLKRDGIIMKRNNLQRRVDKEVVVIKQLVKEKRKDEAVYFLGKKKILEKSLKSISEKLSYIEGRINRIEEVQDDVEFTSIVNDSNQVIKQLLQQVDLEAVKEANDLDAEINLNNEDILRIIDQNKHDPDIVKEFEMLGGDSEESEEILDQKVKDLLLHKKELEHETEVSKEIKNPDVMFN
jgi:hypothetical protein